MQLPRFARQAAVVLATAVVASAIAVPATVFAVTRFSDVPRSSRYFKDVNAVVSTGVMQTCGPRKFCPQDAVTRQQLARSLNRLGALAPGSRPVARAASALTAANATHATTADSATHATTADDATRATTAANATHATTADNATSATTAGTATNATTAGNATQLGGVDASGYLTPQGQVLVQAATANWHPFNSTDPLSQTFFSSQTQWTRSTAGSSFMSIAPDFPSVLYGRALQWDAVEFCFDTFGSTSLNYVELNRMNHTTGNLGRNLLMSDPTSRSGSECRLYTLPTPVVLGANDQVNLFIQVNWSAGGSQFAIGRTTFVFTATDTPVAPVAPPPLARPATAKPAPTRNVPSTDVP